MELLSPAGNMERLKYALHYGADAVYCGAKSFGLRASADNFDFEELTAAAAYTHERGKKIYTTVNAFMRNADLPYLKEFLPAVQACGVDALIVTDPATITLAKELIPDMELHLSTQANTTNAVSAKFWHSLGIARVVLARELSLAEIAEIHAAVPELELEAFVHGAMCISYSGRCLLSNLLNGRDGNRGECVQPCRWRYELREKREGKAWMPIEEDERGTYVLNSKDLNMITHLRELEDVGVVSAKIEGRMKTTMYVSSVTNAYRMALDDMYANREFDPAQAEELEKFRHRPYTTGFFYGRRDDAEQMEGNESPRTHEFVAVVLETDEENGRVLIEQRNRFFVKDELEYISPGVTDGHFTVSRMYTMEGEEREAAPHPKEHLWIETDAPLRPMDVIRKKL